MDVNAHATDNGQKEKKMAGENVCVLGLSPDPDGQPLIAQHKNLGTVAFM